MGVQFCVRLAEIAAAAEQRVDPRKKDRQLERFGDVIIAANVQPHDDVGLLVGGGQKQDRHPGTLTDHPAQVEPGPVGQAHVQDHQVAAACLPAGFGFRAGLCNGQRIALLLQGEGEAFAQAGVVFYKKDPFHVAVLLFHVSSEKGSSPTSL